ncbi:thioredoxin [Labilibacter sediminis]|nr:thioredoxin [Labilibacter sediminis]
MKRILFISLISFFTLTLVSGSDKVNSDGEKGENKVIYLNKDTFKELVFNYETNKEWKYNGNVPAILDFYADWCGPCRQVAPILDQLQKEYDGKIQVFKVNTDKEKELASVFGIRSLPTIVFIPLNGEPQAAMGFRPKADMEKMVTEILKVNK